MQIDSLPIVSTKVGDSPHIWIDKKNISYGDQQERECLAHAIMKLFQNRSMMEMFQESAGKVARRYTWTKVSGV